MNSFLTAISRRRLLGGAASAGLLAQAGGQTSGKRPRALALIGDRYHNPDYIRVSLDRVFRDVGIPVDYTILYDQLTRDLLKNFDLFLCLRDGMIWPNGYLGPDAYGYERGLENDFPEPKPESWITEEARRGGEGFRDGRRRILFIAQHSHVSLSSKNYREVMGGAYIGHPELRPFHVRVTNKEHPITQGIQDFMVNDEATTSWPMTKTRST